MRKTHFDVREMRDNADHPADACKFPGH